MQQGGASGAQSVCGLIGGLSYVSTLDYYKSINENVNKALGGLHSARIMINSLNLSVYANMLFAGEDNNVIEYIESAANDLSRAGAEFIILSSNTAHIAAESIQQRIPVLHIVDCCVYQIKKHMWSPNIAIGFIGTKFSTEKLYIRSRFAQHGAKLIVPPKKETIDEIQHVIENDLSCTPIITSRLSVFQYAIAELIENGAQVVVLGCTEIPLIVKQEHFPNTILIDSGAAHIDIAARVILKQIVINDLFPNESL